MIFEGDLSKPPSMPLEGDWLIDVENFIIYVYENKQWLEYNVVSNRGEFKNVG